MIGAFMKLLFQDNAEVWRYLPSDKNQPTKIFPMPDLTIQNNTRQVHVHSLDTVKKYTKSKQGNEQTRTFEPTNESADCRPAIHSYNFIIRVK